MAQQSAGLAELVESYNAYIREVLMHVMSKVHVVYVVTFQLSLF